ncbi:MAG: aspartate carbamoyltransferase catalytic subunit [Desulfohalobiaceae bacterium]
MPWSHKSLLSVDQLSKEDIQYIFQLAQRFEEINARPVKKAPTLKGKSVLLLFAEASTRTKTSFDIAAKRLSADTFALGSTGSSLQKGESLKDTVLTLQAMWPDLIVLRHQLSGSAQFIAQNLDCSVINAGDGWHAHPTQALLDGYTLSQAWDGGFQDKTLLILGDIAHSRVARSDVQLFSRLGARIRLCAPRTLLPPRVEQWPAEVYTDLNKACAGVDAVQCLRLQLERQQAGLLPDLREYATYYGLQPKHMARANAGARIMHPGPMIRGLEIASALADSSPSLILDQVRSGVCVRMALLYLLLAGVEQ